MNFKEIRALFDIEDDSNGFSENEILETEERLSIKMPKVLRAYYRKLGTHQKLNHSQNRLKYLDQLEIEETGMLEFYVENQHTVSWGINVHAEPPKVFIKYDQDWELADNNLESFLTAMAYFQAIFSSEFHANSIMVSTETIKKVKADFKKIESVTSFWGGDFYRNKSTELIAVFNSDDQADLYVTAKNENDFVTAINKINVDWEYNSQTDR